ncbi:MAG: DNA mismatch repair endonuclease MutL [Firmicutes bacterium]|nr:DNA mismatch repair endonuclease MutL [Bacillota bacterium]
MANIKVMDEILSNKIAAGEVVEKCVSVVKELVENSIDAKSSEIKIELIDSGTIEIKVIDNGIGMDNDDAKLAFQRHATSKLYDEDDLYRIDTLGFRGEALPSIASVSEIILKTSTGGVGSLIHFKGGKLIKCEKCDARKGTSITVKNLFYNTPARLKHLSSLNTELSNIVDYINRIALSYPNIKFTLSNNNRILLNTPGDDNLLKVINSIYGIDVTKNMLDISNFNNDYEINGYISKPVVNRANRSHVITLVNGRVVRNNEINKTIIESYHTYMPETKFPIVVLKIDVDSSLIDVNIHPTKMDIKFSNINELKTLIRNTIINRLNSINLIPTIETPKPISYEEVSIKSNYVQETIDFAPSKGESTYSLIKSELEENISDTSVINEDLALEEKIEKKQDTIPELYIAGYAFGTYIICQNDLGLYLIDQHAAKERINYEKTSYMLSNPNKQNISMLFPLTIELPLNEFIIIKENIDVLNNMYFEISEFGMNSFVVKSHPIWLPSGHEEEAIRKIFDLVITMKDNFTLEKFNDRVAMTMACKMSIKANDNLSNEEMEELIKDLRKCNNPYTCPHGRPTIINFTKYELEKMFKRVMN